VATQKFSAPGPRVTLRGAQVSIDPSLILMRLSALLLRRSRLPGLLLSLRSSDSCSDFCSLTVGSPSLPLLPAA
jgi:hypothetical protein